MIISIGEALIDVVVGADGSESEHVGGSPLNVAIALARLGAQATLRTTIGNDNHGQMIRNALEADGVVLDNLPSAQNSATSVGTATLHSDGAATYEFKITWAPQSLGESSARTTAIHTGSLAAALSPGAEALLSLFRQEHDAGTTTLTFDPNIRPALQGERKAAVDIVEEFVRLVQLVKVSDEDLAWLYPGFDHGEIAAAWLGLGPAVVVVTLGEGGSYALSQSHCVDVKAKPTTVIDTVGAGDSFMGALLYSLHQMDLLAGGQQSRLYSASENELQEALGSAAEVAAITVSRSGANPPRLTEVSFA